MGFSEIQLRKNVKNALFATPIRWVNFRHDNRMISPVTFYQLAIAINAGNVKFKVDSSIHGRIAFYDQSENAFIASDSSFGESKWDEKALLIHESAHAILDGIYAGINIHGKKANMQIVDDEIIGFLAGAFYLVAAGASGASRTAPEREAIKIARSKLNPRPQWDGCHTFTFSPDELRPLRNAIISDPHYRSDWSKASLHNGF